MPRLLTAHRAALAAPSSTLGRLVTLAPGSKGVDTSAAITLAQAKALAAAGYTFVMRYVKVGGGLNVVPLTASERDLLWSCGLAIGIVQTYRKPSTITGPLGTEDGLQAVSEVADLLAPGGLMIATDCEGVYPSASVLIDYENEWYTAVYQAGQLPCFYNGPEPNMTREQIGQSLLFERYWKSGANVPFPTPRGYVMIQGSQEIEIAGGAFDTNLVQLDTRGCAATFWAGPAAA
jgi:hypothetical protein